MASAPGFSLLRAWVDEDPKRRNQSAIGRRLGLSQSAVSAWLREISRPDDDHRKALEVLTDGRVPEESWETEEDRAARDARLARLRAHPIDEDTIPPPSLTGDEQ